MTASKQPARKRAAIVRLAGYPQDMLVRREATALRDAGFETHIFCLRGCQPAEEVIDAIYVHRLPLRRKKGAVLRTLFEYVMFFWLVACKLTLFHWRKPWAVIQVNTMPDFLVFATLIPRLLGAKVTLQMYEPMPELWATQFSSFWLTKFLQQIEQWSLRYAHAAFTVTQTLKERFVSRGADPCKITVVLNVPDPQFFAMEHASPPKTDSSRFTLLCHGAVEERYGHDTMLQAIELVRATLPNVCLRITGNGSYRQALVRQIEQRDLQDHVQYLGYVSWEQLVEELTNADAGIVAQKSSPYSNLVHTGKMYDFLAFGKPVIVSRLEAVRAYFGEDMLFFFEAGNPHDLARAILEVYHQPCKRARMVQNALRAYRQYSWENQKIAYLGVYHRLVTGLTHLVVGQASSLTRRPGRPSHK
ncbi:MAG: glycosyltransferase [Caldilineae bacterium]|nr:MAG: glycosyltransferase [Caldilineae bacterium]